MMNQTVQIANYPPVTVGELRAAGIYWHPQRGLGAMPNWMPVTQEDRDHLGEVRNQKLKRLKYLAIGSMILSIVSIGIGFGSIANSAPEYNFPHSLGGGIIIGALVILYCVLVLAMVKEGDKCPSGDTTTSCFRCLTTCNMIFMFVFASTAAVAVGMGGIWATVDCANRTPEDDTAWFTINSCTPNTGTLYALGVMTLLIGSVLFILFISMNCMICCNYRAFGVKSNYEMFADYQMLRMQEMNRQMQQSQPPPQQQQQYYHPGQGPYQGQGQAGGYQYAHGFSPVPPTAPMIQEDHGYHKPNSDEPPSYGEVIQSGKYTV